MALVAHCLLPRRFFSGQDKVTDDRADITSTALLAGNRFLSPVVGRAVTALESMSTQARPRDNEGRETGLIVKVLSSSL